MFNCKFAEKALPLRSGTAHKECLNVLTEVRSMRIFCQIKIIYLKIVDIHINAFHIWQLSLLLSSPCPPPLLSQLASPPSPPHLPFPSLSSSKPAPLPPLPLTSHLASPPFIVLLLVDMFYII